MPRADETTVQVQCMAPSACRLLIVEEDEVIRLKLAAMLMRAGYDVHTARTTEEALLAMDETFCPIVVSDWHMPEVDGAALCRELRSRQVDGYVYLILLTGRNSKRDIVAGLAAGADDYIARTASTEEFLARVDVGRRIIGLEQSLRSMNRENRRLADTDPLTGAHNRRFLMKYLPREFDRCQRYGHPLSVLVCDLDHFKRINDTLGHDAGDEVLQGFVSRVSHVLRRSCDWIARSGGEEFVIVLPETALAEAAIVADKIRQTVAGSPIVTAAGHVPVTVSIGVSSATPGEAPDSSSTELLRMADRCLYRSKERGRNCTTVSTLLAGEAAPGGTAASSAAGAGGGSLQATG